MLKMLNSFMLIITFNTLAIEQDSQYVFQIGKSQNFVVDSNGLLSCGNNYGECVNSNFVNFLNENDNIYSNWLCENETNQLECSKEKNNGINGVCGLTNNSIVSEQPENNLCNSGDLNNFQDSINTYNWNCNGLLGDNQTKNGTNSNCYAFKEAMCDINYGSCIVGNPLYTSEIGADTVLWNCNNSNVSIKNCSKEAEIGQNGTCGTSNNQSFNIAPTSNLCATGTVSNFKINSLNYEWKCEGELGTQTKKDGNEQDCSAIKNYIITFNRYYPQIGTLYDHYTFTNEHINNKLINRNTTYQNRDGYMSVSIDNNDIVTLEMLKDGGFVLDGQDYDGYHIIGFNNIQSIEILEQSIPTRQIYVSNSEIFVNMYGLALTGQKIKIKLIY